MDPVFLHTAVQEERQRAKDRNENEVESSSSANEDMPVEKILEAELAVEPKTETYIETNLGVPSNSVSKQLRWPRPQLLFSSTTFKMLKIYYTAAIKPLK